MKNTPSFYHYLLLIFLVVFSGPLFAAVQNDKTPDVFAFVDKTGVDLNVVLTSNAITVSGINVKVSISISGGKFSINDAAFRAGSATVSNGDAIKVQVSSSNSYDTTKNVILKIGSITDTFSITTKSKEKPSTQTPASGFYLPPASTGNPLFVSEHFAGSGVCAKCHDNIMDDANKEVSIQKDWSATMMANAARDPFWKAQVRSEIRRNPQLNEIISDKCTRCHAPMANAEAKFFKEPNAILAADDGFLSATHPRHDPAVNGVSCTLCHQIEDAKNLGKLSSFSGQYQISNNKFNYGPYTSPNGMFMVTDSGYTPLFSLHIKSSKLCATCHNLKTPYVDQFGKILSNTPDSEFPEQMFYSEWENSAYATTTPKSCQQCHMPRANGVKIANMPLTMPTDLKARDNFAIHEFVGANKLMLDIFNNNKTQLGVLATSEALNKTLEKTQSMLSSAANITVVSSQLSADNHLDFTLKINSTTGHKLPSGYPSRRVILNVRVYDSADKLVFESGKINEDGSVQGLDADSNRATFEPHYDVITSPNQVQVYEAIMGNNLNEVTYTLLRGKVYLKDNRILPVGFNKAKANNDVKVIGSARNDENFIGGSDEIRFRMAGFSGNLYHIEATLVHQPLAYSFAQDLFSDSSDEADDFKTMFITSKLKTNQITLTRFSVLR
jgi:hypothetical protein